MAVPLRTGVLIAPFAALFLVFIAGWIGLGPSLTVFANGSVTWLMQSLGWAFAYTGILAIIAVIALCAFIGDYRIGGQDFREGYSGFAAIAIGVAASTSLGILFWATAEPIVHIHQPPTALGITARTEDAQIFARYATMIHWAIIPNAMNALCMSVFALTIQNLHRQPTLDGAIFRAPDPQPAGSVLDSFIIFFATLMVAGAFASCIAALSGEMTRFGSDTLNPAALFSIALAMGCIIFLAGARPIRMVFGVMARISIILMGLMMLAALVIGPTGDILFGGLYALFQMILSLPSQLTYTGLPTGDPWPQTWTMTHWGNAMLLSPLIGLFLSRAARGYQLNDAIVYFTVIPALISIAWIFVFGGLALSIDEATGGSIWAKVSDGKIDDAVYAAFWGLNGGEALIIGFFVLIAIGFATFAAAVLHAVMRICAPNPGNDAETGSARAGVALIWCAGVGVSGWGLASYGVGHVVETLARLGSLPALIATLGFLVSAIRLMLRPGRLIQTRKPESVKVDFDVTGVIDEIDTDEAAPPRRRKRKSA